MQWKYVVDNQSNHFIQSLYIMLIGMGIMLLLLFFKCPPPCLEFLSPLEIKIIHHLLFLLLFFPTASTALRPSLGTFLKINLEMKIVQCVRACRLPRTASSMCTASHYPLSYIWRSGLAGSSLGAAYGVLCVAHARVLCTCGRVKVQSIADGLPAV